MDVRLNGNTTAVYQTTRAMVVDEYGNVLTPPKAIQARLNPGGADKPFLMDGKAAWLVGENDQWKLCTLDASLQLEMISLEIR